MKTIVNNLETIKFPKMIGDKLLVKGKLILVPCKFIESVFGLNSINNLKLSKNINGSQIKGWYKPIIISETEHIYRGDLHSCYNIREKKFGHYGGELYEFNRLILALSNNLSSNTLQDIIDGKLKNGSEIYIECEHNNSKNYISLDSKQHITLHNFNTPKYTDNQLLDLIEWLNKNTYFNGGSLQVYSRFENTPTGIIQHIKETTTILQ